MPTFISITIHIYEYLANTYAGTDLAHDPERTRSRQVKEPSPIVVVDGY